MKEIWKSLDGIVLYGENYEVSNLGKVRNAKTKKLITADEKNTKYACVRFYATNKRKWHSVHRLVALAFIPNPDNKPQVNHLNGNKFDNAVTNLEWATQSENQHHAYATGLQPVTRGNAKVDEDSVRKIRKLYPTGKYTQKQLGELFGLDRTQVNKILKGTRWSDVV